MGQSQQSRIVNAKLKAKEWQWEMKREVKNLDKEIKKIEKEVSKLQNEAKAQGAKSQNAGTKSIVQNYVKQVVRSRKAIERLEKAKANLNTVDLQVTTMMATMSTTSSLTISADIMARMNKIANTEGVSDAMAKMKLEMGKCQDAEDKMEEAFAESDEEHEIGVEMDRVMDEIGLDAAVFGVLSQPAPGVSMPAAAQQTPVAPVPKVAIVEGTPAPAPPKAPPAQQQPQQSQQPSAPPPQPPVEGQSGYPSGQESTQPPTAPPAPGGGEDDLLARLAALRK